MFGSFPFLLEAKRNFANALKSNPNNSLVLRNIVIIFIFLFFYFLFFIFLFFILLFFYFLFYYIEKKTKKKGLVCWKICKIEKMIQIKKEKSTKFFNFILFFHFDFILFFFFIFFYFNFYLK